MMNWQGVENIFRLNSKEDKLKVRKQYLEHVKRRPQIDYSMEPERQAVWERSQMHLPVSERRDKPVFGFSPQMTEDEKRIIETTIETLMEEYEKSL